MDEDVAGATLLGALLGAMLGVDVIVETTTDDRTVDVDPAGQFVTSGAHEVIVTGNVE